MKNIAFIPVREGSKSIRLKNIKILNNFPLIYWALNALQNSKSINEIIVASDSEIINRTVEGFSFDKVKIYKRKPENAQDDSSTESVMLEYINSQKLNDEDNFMLVQATNPFLETVHIDEALMAYTKSNFDSLLSCVKIKRFFWKDNNPINYNYFSRPRRQDFEGLLLENGSFYINKIKNIKKIKNRLCGNIYCYEMPEYSGWEIDEDDDWIIVEQIIKKYKSSKFDYSKKIKLFITDVDGVLTDLGMYYSSDGNEFKKFNTRDGVGLELLRNCGIKTAIITSENTKIVENRAKKLKIDYFYQGVNNKLEVAIELCKKENISMQNIAFIGDDINDIELLKYVGLAACPSNAIEKLKRLHNIITLYNKGGDGVVREFIESIMKPIQKWQ